MHANALLEHQQLKFDQKFASKAVNDGETMQRIVVIAKGEKNP